MRRSFEPERVDRIETRSFLRRVEAKKDPRGRRKPERHRDGINRDLRWPRHPALHALREAETERDADAAADQTERNGLHQKLQQYVPALGANRHAQADL